MMLSKNNGGHSTASGFTLIELSVVMVIIGLLSAALLNLYNTYNKQKVVTTTSDNIKTAQDALQKYQQDNGFYPCPADPTDPIGRATNCALPAPPGIKVVTGTGGREVRIGTMPLVDMKGETKLLSGSQAVDGWRRRLTYAVTQGMALDATQFVEGQGAITVQDAESGNVIISNGNIVVLSHGEDGAGSYNANGVSVAACPSGTRDAENCNDDAIFVTGNRSLAPGSNYNDDFIEFETAATVETVSLGDKEIIYEQFCGGMDSGVQGYVLMTYAQIKQIATMPFWEWQPGQRAGKGNFARFMPLDDDSPFGTGMGTRYTYRMWPFPEFSGQKLVYIQPCDPPTGGGGSEPGAQ